MPRGLDSDIMSPMRRIILLCCICLYPWSVMAESKAWTLKIEGLKPSDKKALLDSLDFKLKITDDRLKQRVSTDIASYLAIMGYYEPTIECHSTMPKQTTSGILSIFRSDKQQISCTLAYGPSLRIQDLKVTLEGPGRQDPALKTLLTNGPLKPGLRFEEKSYEAYKQLLLTKALEQGYLEATFIENQVRVDLVRQEATIRLTLATGKPFTFGPISFPHAPYPTPFLTQYLSFKPGDPYRTETVFKLQKDLLDSELFKHVRVEPEPDAHGSTRVPLKVHLDPKARNHYTFGLGFGTDTGLRERIHWERRRSALPGHRIQLSAKTSQRANQARMLYSMPLNNPKTDRVDFDTQIVEEKSVDKKYSLRHETILSATKKADRLERTLSTRFLSESFRDLPNTSKQNAHFLLPQIGYTWTQQDAIFNPGSHNQGVRLGLKIQGGLASLGSSTNIIRTDLRLKSIQTLTEKTRVIIRGNLGAMDAKNKGKIPLSLRFFTGGDQSVRGFAYQSLGPTEKDPLGNLIVIGGRYLVVGSIECERTLYKKMGMAVFSDAGNAMNHFGQKLFYSAGFGLRFATALGSLRIDLAQALPTNQRKPRLHLNFGMDF